MSCYCESDSSLLHLLCDSEKYLEEVCEEGECFSTYTLSMKWSLDAGIIEADMCINFEET